MQLIPAMSIMSGRVVVVKDGQYDFLRNEDGRFRNPVNVVQEQETEEVFILDIDGIETNKPDLNLILKLSAHKDVWVDAGSQTAGDAADVLISGAARAVMGTKTMKDFEQLAEAVDLSANIIFSLDHDNGMVAASKTIAAMGADALLEEVGELEIDSGMLFDLGGNRDGRTPDLDAMKKIAGRFSRSYVAGHIQRGDVEHLENMSLTGAIMDFRSMECQNG